MPLPLAQELRARGSLRDPAAAERRAAERRERVASGLLELDRWLADQVRAGLAGFDRLPPAHVDRMAARLVDAQASGVAALVRGLRYDLGRDDWPDRVLDRLGALHLLSRAHRRLDELPAPLAATVRIRVGYPIARAEVAARPPVLDDWLALGTVEQSDGQLISRRSWLWGLRTRTWALHLCYAPTGQRLEDTVDFGEIERAAAYPYPGSGQFRVLLTQADSGPSHAAAGPAALPPGGTLLDMREQFGRLLADDPWASRLPVVVRGVPLPPGDDPDQVWWLQDATGRSCPLGGGGPHWPLLALSRGKAVAIFGEWTGEHLLPLAVLPVTPGESPVPLAGRPAGAE